MKLCVTRGSILYTFPCSILSTSYSLLHFIIFTPYFILYTSYFTLYTSWLLGRSSGASYKVVQKGLSAFFWIGRRLLSTLSGEKQPCFSDEISIHNRKQKIFVLITYSGQHKVRSCTLEVYINTYIIDMYIIYMTRMFAQSVRDGIFL